VGFRLDLERRSIVELAEHLDRHDGGLQVGDVRAVVEQLRRRRVERGDELGVDVELELVDGEG
jgi:hypothetical protein